MHIPCGGLHRLFHINVFQQQLKENLGYVVITPSNLDIPFFGEKPGLI